MSHSIASVRIDFFRTDNTLYGTEWNGKRMHDDYHRLYFVAEGNAKVVYDGTEQQIVAGHTYLFPPTREFRYWCPERLWLLNVCFKMTLANNIDVLDVHPWWVELRTPDTERTRRRMAEIGERLNSPGFSDQLRIRGVLMDLLSPHFFQAQLTDDFRKRRRDIGRLQPAVAAIHSDPMCAVKVADLPAMVNMSRSYFAKKFRDAYGMSAQEYLRKHRIEKVKEDLRATNLSIAIIAETYGFSSPSHLTMEFKKITGDNHTDYRRRGAFFQ